MTGAAEAGLDGESAADWLVCRAGTALCALPLQPIGEVMRPLPVEPVAAPPPGLRGLSLIRGAPVPVLDLAALLGEPGMPSRRFVTATVAGRKVAFAVDAVLGVRWLDPSLAGTLPPLLRDSARDAVAAIGALDAELLFLLETGRLLPADLLDRLGGEAAS